MFVSNFIVILLYIRNAERVRQYIIHSMMVKCFVVAERVSTPTSEFEYYRLF